MKGITVIEEHFCRAVEMPGMIVSCVLFTLLCAGVLAIYRIMYRDAESRGVKRLTIICSIAIVILCIGTWVLNIHRYGQIHYEYTIEVDDSVHFNEFFDRYEIINVDGDRYRVKEIDEK